MRTLCFDDRYPADLLAAREAKLRGFWAGDGPRALLSMHDGSFPYRQTTDDELIVEHAARTILASADISEDYLPWFGPDFGTISTACYWGGEVRFGEGGKPFIQPVIHGIDDVDTALPGDPAGGHVARAISLARRVKERLGTEHIWTRCIDLQGPLSTASLLWEQEDLFCSMYTDPDVVHRLLDRVTEHLIAMIRAMQQGMGPTCGAVWPYIWQPEDLGVTITEDMMPLMSPDLYREFGLPYLKRIADTFGGVFVHCCGAFEQHLPAMVESGVQYRGLEYFEPHARTEAVYEALGPGLVYACSYSPQGDVAYGSYARFLTEHLAKVAPKDMRLWFCYESTWEGAAEHAALVQRLFGG